MSFSKVLIMNIKSDYIDALLKVWWYYLFNTFSSTSLTVTVSDPGFATCTTIGDPPGRVSWNKINVYSFFRNPKNISCFEFKSHYNEYSTKKIYPITCLSSSRVLKCSNTCWHPKFLWHSMLIIIDVLKIGSIKDVITYPLPVQSQSIQSVAKYEFAKWLVKPLIVHV